MHQDTLQVQHCTNQLLREEQERNTQELREGPKGGSVTSCKTQRRINHFNQKMTKQEDVEASPPLKGLQRVREK
jgi:hypothetical protein